jgi:phage N-6-adenine-methyltransferase
MVAAKLANMSHGGDRKSDQAENLPLVSQAKAADMLNVSDRSVRTAKKVQEEAIPEITEKVSSGEISLNAAAMAASLPEEEQQEIVEEIKQGVKPAEAVKNHVLATKHTGDEESYTPVVYLDSARAVMGQINTDPASNPMAQENVKADVYYTVDDDGLAQDWIGKVWMNPPYTARVINQFIDKLVSHFESGDVSEAIVLTNNNTDTSWFHQAAKHASAVCFTAGRINFLKRDGSKSSPTNGQSFIYFGENIAAFKQEFSKHGLVMVKA